MAKQSMIYVLEALTPAGLTSKGYYSIINLYKAAISSVKYDIANDIVECGDLEKDLLTHSSCYIWNNKDWKCWMKVYVYNMEDSNDVLPWLKH